MANGLFFYSTQCIQLHEPALNKAMIFGEETTEHFVLCFKQGSKTWVMVLFTGKVYISKDSFKINLSPATALPPPWATPFSGRSRGWAWGPCPSPLFLDQTEAH